MRNVDIWSSSDEEVDEEQEILEGDEEEEADVTITSTPVTDYFPTIPGPPGPTPSTSTSPIAQHRDLGLGTSPKTTTSTHMLPAMSRTRSRGRGNTPQSPAMDEPSYSNGTAISRTSSRRTSGHSMSGRRPASFLFSPFGNGMTPLPSMISSQSQGGSVPNGLSANATPLGVPAENGGYGHAHGHGHGHGHSASVDFYNGRRSRATSTTGDYSLRPLIRQLSTVGMGVGGDDGVPVAGAESSKAGLGLEGLPLPTRQVAGAGAGAGDDGLPPMGVSPSDAPPSTVRHIQRLWFAADNQDPKSFGTDQKPSGPPSPKSG